MSYNGSGTFSINSTGQPVVAGTTITATAFNALTADLATGLTTAMCRDGQSTATGNLPMGGFKLTGLGSGTAATDSATLAQVQGAPSSLLTGVSGASTITASASPTLTAYVTGQSFWFRAASTNSGAVTLNIDGLGAQTVTKGSGSALTTGDLIALYYYQVVYTGTGFRLVSNAFSIVTIASPTLGTSAASITTINGTAVTTPNGLNFDSNTLVIDATNDRVGIGTASPGQTLSVTGTASVSGNVTLGTTGADTLTLNGTAISCPNNLNFDSNTLFIDATNNRVGIGTASPARTLAVAGVIESTTGGFRFPDGTTQTTAGRVVQQQYASSTAYATGTTTIPFDDTIPQITEGTEFLTATITPTSSSNALMIEVQAVLSCNNNVRVIAALFQDSTANALSAAVWSNTGIAGTRTGTITLRYRMTAGTTSATTFRLRIGGDVASTIYFNGDNNTTARIFGGACVSSMTVTEIS